jgi:hypothetical protein
LGICFRRNPELVTCKTLQSAGNEISVKAENEIRVKAENEIWAKACFIQFSRILDLNQPTAKSSGERNSSSNKMK